MLIPSNPHLTAAQLCGLEDRKPRLPEGAGDSFHPGVGPRDHRAVPGQNTDEVETGRSAFDVARFRGVDPPETVLLHRDVPEVEGGGDR